MKENSQVPSDPELVSPDTGFLARRVQKGDRAAFQKLYDKVAPSLYAWTRLRLQGGPSAGLDPQDVLQEVWLRAVRGFASYDERGSFRGWLLGITKNVLLQSYRNRSYDELRGAGAAAGGELAAMDCPDSVTSISMRLTKDESIQHFLEYVGGLAADDRMLVLYCGFEEVTCAEAATRLGLSHEATSKRWQSLRARMRENGTLRALALEESG